MSRSSNEAAEPVFAVEVHQDLDGLSSLWPHAGASGEGAYHVFQGAEFIGIWQKTYGVATKARTLFVAVREADGSPLLLLPLSIAKRGTVRVLTFIDAAASDYNAPVVFPTKREWTPGAVAQLWARVKAALPAFDIAVLEKMPAEVGGLVNPLFLLAKEDHPEACHGNDLARPWAEVEAGIHGLRTLRKSARALNRIAPTRIEVAETPAVRGALLATLLAQKQRRFEQTRVPGFDRHPEKRAFFEQATEVFAAQGALHLSGLYVGDEIVASLWGLVHAGRYYALMIGFEDGRWASYSPGRVLYLMAMQSLHERGCSVFDLGIGDEPWKLAQSDHSVRLRRHTDAVTWRGRAYLKLTRTATPLRGSRLWERARPYKWVILRGLRRIGAGWKSAAATRGSHDSE